MSDCCLMVHHEIRTRNEGRAKRPREQAVVVGMDISNQQGEIAMLNREGINITMEVEPCSNEGVIIDTSSSGSRKEIFKTGGSPKQVTDDSCESEDTEKGKLSREGCTMQKNTNNLQSKIVKHVIEEGHNMSTSQKESTMKRTGPIMEDDQQSSMSTTRTPTLPQHEQIQRVEPPDINYQSTPACMKLRDALISRLRLIAPTGRIQVVSTFVSVTATLLWRNY